MNLASYNRGNLGIYRGRTGGFIKVELVDYQGRNGRFVDVESGDVER